MMRLIVGPRVEIPDDTLTFACESHAVVTNEAGQSLCGATATVPVQAQQSFIIDAEDGYMVTQILVDGEYIAPYDEVNMTGDERLSVSYDEWGDEGHTRPVFVFNYTGAGVNHTVQVLTSEWHADGIDDVASRVNMAVRPNPATDQVAISLSGVKGMVDCSIIDMSGRVVLASTVNAEQTAVLNLNNVPAGAYFVRVVGSDFSKVEKLIVR